MEFADYIELPEYQNILTRMLGADAFPYSNVTVDRKVCLIILSLVYSILI